MCAGEGFLPDPNDDSALFHCPLCRVGPRPPSCVLTGLLPDDTARLIPCAACRRVFHPTAVTPKAGNCDLEPVVSLSLDINGVWKCSICTSAPSTEKVGAAAIRETAQRRPKPGTPTDPAIELRVIAEAAQMLAKLPSTHYGSLIATRLKSIVAMQQSYLSKRPNAPELPGIRQLAALEHVQLRYRQVLDAVKIADEGWDAPDRNLVPIHPASSSSSGTKDAGIAELAKTFLELGFCFPDAGSKLCLSTAMAQASNEAVTAAFNSAMSSIRRLGLSDQLVTEGFRTFKPRGKDRYDLMVPELDTAPAFTTDAPWLFVCPDTPVHKLETI